MPVHPQDYALLPLVSRILVALAWVGFVVFFAFVKRPGGEAAVQRERAATIGIALQMIAFAVVWMIQRPLPRAASPLGTPEIVRDLIAPALSIASVWLGLAAVRILGREWSYAARLLEGHRLVVQGPYRLVRHPIYSAMLGKLLAANFAFGHWLGLAAAVPIFLIGTVIRIRSEERLLRSRFGDEYEAYARRVPALVPGLR